MVTEPGTWRVLSFQLRPAPGSGWLMFGRDHHSGVGRHDVEHVADERLWVVGTMVGISMLFSGPLKRSDSRAMRWARYVRDTSG
jgi:hypothetical protein